MNISSNCLYHFTGKKRLINILKEKKIYASYCKEFVLSDEFIAVPMISFCDIPLKQGVERTRYGKYAIGFKREWALSKRLNPVFYINQESDLPFLMEGSFISAVHYKMEANKIAQELRKNLTEPSNLKGALENGIEIATKSNSTFASLVFEFNSYIQCFIKRSDVNENNSDHKIPRNYKFYDEREWRFVPKIEDNIFGWINKTEYDIWRGSSKKKPFLTNHFLEFTLADIEHIVINHESEFEQVIKINGLQEYSDIAYKFEFMDKINKNF